MAKKDKQAKGGNGSKIKRSDVVSAAVESLKALKSVAGAKVTKCKVEDGSKLRFTLDNGFEVRARVKAAKA